MRKQPHSVHDGIHVQSIAKYLERMGDHATNLAEQVVFMIKGKDIRHGRA
jgi:phosphate transport system protein